MSGGSYNYLYSLVKDAAHQIMNTPDPKRRAFATHLLKVADALHDIEWVDSSDMAPGDEHKAIDAVLTPGMEAAAATEMLRETIAHATAALNRLTKERA